MNNQTNAVDTRLIKKTCGSWDDEDLPCPIVYYTCPDCQKIVKIVGKCSDWHDNYQLKIEEHSPDCQFVKSTCSL